MKIDSEVWEMVGVAILALIAIFYFSKMNEAQEVIHVLKFGFIYLGTLILYTGRNRK
jgi:hypothetical protein